MKKTIRVDVDARIPRFELSQLEPLQGKLKSLSEENFNKLKKSILDRGFFVPVFLWENTELEQSGLRLLDGHQRVRVLLKLRADGYDIPPVPAVLVEATDEKEAKRKLLAITSSYGKFEEQGLYEFMVGAEISMDELETDFTLPDIDLESFRIEFFDEPKILPEADEDAVPEPPVEPKSKLGDLWTLGRHRLLCGDSTDVIAVDRLIQGESIGMLFTDPPYGMRLDTNFHRSDRVVGNSYRAVIGDDSDYDPTWMIGFFQNAREIFIWGADYFHDHLPKGGSFMVWDKRNDELEKAVGNDFELCWSKNHHKRLVFRHLWSGFTAKEKNELRVHPTQKPIKLAEWFFERWGMPNETVADLYGGSGSTLIACEKTDRSCLMMEIDPRYCDVILRRFAEYTGQDPVRDDGVKWSELGS